MNELSPERQEELRLLLAGGLSLRKAAQLAGVAKQTAVRYRALWNIDALCPCGQDSRHRGWCSMRLYMGPQRAEWLKRKFWMRNLPARPWVNCFDCQKEYRLPPPRDYSPYCPACRKQKLREQKEEACLKNARRQYRAVRRVLRDRLQSPSAVSTPARTSRHSCPR